MKEQAKVKVQMPEVQIPTAEQVREAAYHKWQRIGSPWMSEEAQGKLWLEAEEDLLRERRKPYRILFSENNGHGGIEVRKYYPQKRLIIAAHREYYLQFPYFIFACRTHATGSYLYVGFAKQDDETIYFPSLPNMCPQTYGICLARAMGDGHFKQSIGTTLDSLIELFWITEFDPWDYGWEVGHRALKQNFQGRYNYWKGLSLPEVLEHISYMPRPFDFFIERISKHYEDMDMRRLISSYTGCEEAVAPAKKVIVADDSSAPAFQRAYL